MAVKFGVAFGCEVYVISRYFVPLLCHPVSTAAVQDARSLMTETCLDHHMVKRQCIVVLLYCCPSVLPMLHRCVVDCSARSAGDMVGFAGSPRPPTAIIVTMLWHMLLAKVDMYVTG
jgi:hypothetical protein